MNTFLAILRLWTGCLVWMPTDPVTPPVTRSERDPRAGEASTAGKPDLGDKPGGFRSVSATERGVKATAAFAIQAHQQALREKPAGQAGSGSQTPPAPRLELVRILGAEQQVVAGLNYRLQLRVTLDGEEKTAEALVWWQAWRKPEPYQLTSWTWK